MNRHPRRDRFAGPAAEAGAGSSFLGRLHQDVRWATSHALLNSVGGSVWLPRVARRLIYRAAGASMRSAPGMRFVFAGDPRNLSVGTAVYFNYGVFIEAIAPVTVGEYCAFGMEAMVLTSHHPVDRFGHWSHSAVGRPVTIGDRVWVGARALILPGAVIESGVVIAAGAVVSGTCRAGGIYAGVPARRIREFDDPRTGELDVVVSDRVD